MALNAALEGTIYPPVRFTVEPERVRAFGAAVAHDGPGVPPTFATVPEIAAGLANVLSDPALGLDLSDVLHGEQEYEWRRAFEMGETLTAEARIESIRSKGGMQFLTLRTELQGRDGELVVLARSTLIVRDTS